MRTSLPDLDIKLALEFEKTLETALDSVPLTIFICGKALPKTASPKSKKAKKGNGRDLRLYLQLMLEKEFKSCRVRLGEHKQWMRIYGRVAGSIAFNLADHEIALARTIDLVVIFPCSPGSFAELGMFSVEERIAEKMVVFVDSKFRKSKSYIIDGPIAAARRRKSAIYTIKYSDREQIFKRIRDLILRIRANKGKAKLLS